MAANDSIRDDLDAHDIACMRVRQAKAISTILAMATSPDADGPSRELISVSLDGITALLEDAEHALLRMNFRPSVRAA